MSFPALKVWDLEILEEGLEHNGNDMQAPLEEQCSGDEQYGPSQELVAYVSHELRNTLAPIFFALKIMNRRRIEDPILREARDVLTRQTTQMTLLVDDLLSVSQLTCGKIYLQKRIVALSDVLAQAVETSRPAIDSRAHKLIVTLPPFPIHLEADYGRLVQVFVNLLNNASKYTQCAGTIRVTASRNAEQAVVCVQDTGVGIANEMLLEVFDMFHQEHCSLGKSQGGLGIGLFVVRTLIELHGGTVLAQSAGHGAGSTFIVRLPCIPIGSPIADCPEQRTEFSAGDFRRST